MNKRELTEAIAESQDWSKQESLEALDAVLGAVGKALVGLDDVSLPGFGTFKVSVRKERQGRNPQTGDAVTIPESIAVTFKPSSKLKDDVNGR